MFFFLPAASRRTTASGSLCSLLGAAAAGSSQQQQQQQQQATHCSANNTALEKCNMVHFIQSVFVIKACWLNSGVCVTYSCIWAGNSSTTLN